MNLRYLSMTQLSEITGVDRRTVKSRLAEVEPYKEEGSAILYDAREAIPKIMQFEDKTKDNTWKDLQKEQLRYEKARADKVQLENDTKRGELVRIEDVTRTVGKEYAYVRAAILTLPSKVAKSVSLEEDPAVCQSILKKEVDEILNHLQADNNLNIEPEEVDEKYFPEDEES
jgi:phage terminase Nu1 subunit (DNA packaging protein)